MNEDDDTEFSEWLEETFRLRGITEVPGHLYKFLSSESKYFPLTMHELMLHSRLYLSSRKDFNDPLDTNFGLDIPDDQETIAAFVKGIIARSSKIESSQEGVAEIAKDPTTFGNMTYRRLSESLDRIGIFSMSERVSHPLMWAHYACSHRGMALIFRPIVGDAAIAAHPIRYQAHYPRSSITAKGLEVYHALVKGLAWEYEREWRVIESNRANTWMDIPAVNLTGIVFGACSTQETYDFVLDLVMRRADAGLPPLLVCRAEVGESFELAFTQFVGNEQWRPINLM